MATHIIQIDKHKFACGLFWQSLSRPRELKKEAADLANKIDCDLMVLRMDHAMAQAGFAHSRDGVRRGMFSLAAAISKAVALEGAYFDGKQQRVHNWLGAFKLPDGMWAYFAVRDANFLPNGDFAGSKEEVLERLQGDYGLGGWNVVIGDRELEEHGFHNFNAKRIEDLLPHGRNGKISTHRWWSLRPFEKRIPWRPIGAAALVLLACGAGATWYWQKLQQRKAEAARARAVDEARMRNASLAAPDVPHPWAGKAAPLPTVRACVERFLHLTAAGWQLDEYVCTPERASYAWSRRQAPISYLLARVPNAVIDLGGEKATYSEALKPAAGGDDVLLEQAKLLPPLTSRLQALRLAPKLTFVPPPPPPPPPAALPGAAPPPPPRIDWKTFSFSVSADGVPPLELAVILSVAGVRIDKLAYRAGAWSIEGVMYAK